MRRTPIPVLILLASATLAACGSSDDSSKLQSAAESPGATQRTTTTKAASAKPKTTAATAKPTSVKGSRTFLTAANTVCRRYNREVKSLQKEIDATSRRAARLKSFRPYGPVMQKAVDASKAAAKEFLNLDVPPADRAKANAVAKVLGAQTNLNQLLQTAAEQDDGQQFGAASAAVQQLSPKLTGVQRGLGMTTICGGRTS